jgi:hypothetical protein
MNKNVSNVDRVIRLVLAVVFFGAAFAVGFGTVFGIILAVLGVVMVATAAMGFCPLYRLFGLSTNKTAATKS